MTVRRALLALPLTLLLVAGCGVDRAAERRDLVAELTEAANDGDADRVRERAEVLIATVADHLERDELSAEQAQQLTELAQSVRQNADVIDADLQSRLKAEADAEAARKELEEAQRRLEEERRKAEEAAKQAGDNKGKGDGDGKDDD